MSKKPLKRTIEELLKMLQRSARNHKRGFRHYTTMRSLVGMLNSEQMIFSLLSNSNDGGEYKSDRHYMLCFNYGEAENIALWALYGIPRNESVRLTFPCHYIIDWLASARRGEVEFYAVVNKRITIPLKVPTPKITICDVAYYDNGICTHNEGIFRVNCDKKTDANPYQNPLLAPYVKKWAWSFEREVRIVLEFDKPVLNAKGQPYKQIAVDFEEPWHALRDGSGEIRLGPWCRRSAETVRRKGFTKAKIVSSTFTNQLRLRTPCAECDKTHSKSCRCKHMKCNDGCV